jgi:hypothetical protein
MVIPCLKEWCRLRDGHKGIRLRRLGQLQQVGHPDIRLQDMVIRLQPQDLALFL